MRRENFVNGVILGLLVSLGMDAVGRALALYRDGATPPPCVCVSQSDGRVYCGASPGAEVCREVFQFHYQFDPRYAQ